MAPRHFVEDVKIVPKKGIAFKSLFITSVGAVGKEFLYGVLQPISSPT